MTRIFNLSISLIICLSILAIPVVLAEETPFTVDFSANITNGTAPLAVNFTNLVTGNQVSGNWTMNNVTFNQLPGPEYTFLVPGKYTISLTVTDDTNTTSTETKPDYIIVSSSIPTTAISFTSSGIWGSNPVIITNNLTGEIAFVGKTSSKNIKLDSDGYYSVEVQPGGITDFLNSPDYGIGVLADFAKDNLVGLLFFAMILVVGAIVFSRR